MSSVAEFLIERLENAGIKHVFSVPGDYIIHFLGKLSESNKIILTNNADEAGAGFAADAYARINGLGCVCVTYNVGALKICNAIAGAYAERSPVIVIAGAPGVSELGGLPLHHVVGHVDCQRQIFKNITCAQTVLDNPITAGYEIDSMFEAARYYKQPVYIELPRDVSLKSILYDVYTLGTPKAPETDLANLEDALKEVATWIECAKNPVILAGVEIARCGLGKDLKRFAERHNIPIACTLLGKSVFDETHPLFIGVYAGSNSSRQHVREIVEKSDCLLVCGEVITEATVGYRPSKIFQKREMVTCTIGTLRVRNHTFPNVSLNDFLHSLFKTELTKRVMPILPAKQDINIFEPKAKLLTTPRFFEQINSILDEDLIVIADTGDSLFGASDLTMAQTFLGPAFYLSMGFAIPAALGAKLAKPKCRPIVIVGDGAFQMSASELSTMIRHKHNTMVFVLNNHGYTTERLILDGNFNNILDWNYHDVVKLMGGGIGVKVQTEIELNDAVKAALLSDQLYVINCIVKDTSLALVRVCDALKKSTK